MTENAGPGAAQMERTWRYRAERALREWDRKAGKYDRTRRFRELVFGMHGQKRWGHKLMALVGRDDCGNWSPPRVRDIYFRHDHEAAVVAKKAGRPVVKRQLITTTDAMTAWDGVRKRHEDWRTFDSQDDGHTIRVGYLGDDGRLHDSGIQGTEEQRLFRRWLFWDDWVKARWFGLRPWLYYKGLHAAINDRKPWTCQVTPPPRSGGYQHWHCEVPVGFFGTLMRWRGLPVEHEGPHRYHNYRWDGPGKRVEYDPR